LTAENYQLVILGEKAHPEVEALLSYVDDSCIVVDDLNEKIPLSKEKAALIAQTTQSEKKFEQLCLKLLRKCHELLVVKTICKATQYRQEETNDIASRVDIMFVIGGKNSANTTRLAEIASKKKCQTYHIETANEITTEMVQNMNKIGISAGASTPEWIIDEIIRKIKKL